MIGVPGLTRAGVDSETGGNPAADDDPGEALGMAAVDDVRIGMNFGADDYLINPVIRGDSLAAVAIRLARAEVIERASKPPPQ